MQPNENSIWGNIGGLLTDAVGAYAQFETIKSQKNSTGQSRIERTYASPELDNGAAVLIEKPKTTTTATQTEPLIFGIPQKTLLLGSVGLLVVGLLLRRG